MWAPLLHAEHFHMQHLCSPREWSAWPLDPNQDQDTPRQELAENQKVEEAKQQMVANCSGKAGVDWDPE